jgi:DNA-binding NarL/FixJ family response regulator
MKINLLIVSMDAVSLAGLQAIVDQDERIRLAGRTTNGPDGMPCLEGSDTAPHVAILGEPPTKAAMCENIAQIVARYRDDRPHPRIIVVSQNDADDVIIAALRAGVVGYLSHIDSPEELLCSVQIAAKGGATFSPTIATRFSRYFSTIESPPGTTTFCNLTGRELEILELLALGMGNRQIARRLFLAEKTVRNYVCRIFAKLGVNDRAAAVLRARAAGFGRSQASQV